MSKPALIAVSAVAACAVSVLAMCLTPRPATAADQWLDELDALARQFTAEMIVEDKAYPLEGPRRMAYYLPKPSPISTVFSGACYALHVNGNPEVIIAIENSGSPEKPTTYIEVSRLSGGHIIVSREGQRVAEFPERPEVRGAYVGMVK